MVNNIDSTGTGGESRRALETKFHAIQELKRRMRAAPLLYYADMLANHPNQKKFHELVKIKRMTMFLGGNRSGKTTGGRMQALAHVYGYRFWEVPNLKLAPNGDLPPRETVSPDYWVRRVDGIPIRVPNVGMIVSGLPRLRGIGQNIFPGLWDSLPENLRNETLKVKVIRSAGSVPDYMEFPNGSKVIFASEEQDDMTFEGFTLDWAWVDEPVRKAIYSALWTRLFDFVGSMWLTLTPLEARAAWMYFDLVQKKDEKSGLVYVNMADNPANTKEMIDEFIRLGQFTKRELAARLRGEFEALGNRAIENFNPSVHICSAFQPPADWIHGLTVDPHHRRPAYMLWWALNPANNTYHFYREWPTGNFFAMTDGGKTPAEYATLIRNIEGKFPATVRLCDPRFGKAEHSRHGFHETSWVDLMAQYGLQFDANIPNTGDISYGVNKIIDMMRYDENFPISPTNHPRIYIHSGLENLQNSLMNWGFEEVKGDRDPFSKFSEFQKDPCDCLRYTCLYNIPVTERQAREMQPYAEDALARENENT